MLAVQAVLAICVVLLCCHVVSATRLFFLMIRRPPRSTLDRSSAASDVYKRQAVLLGGGFSSLFHLDHPYWAQMTAALAVSYTHLRAHETVLDLVCRLLLEKKNKTD